MAIRLKEEVPLETWQTVQAAVLKSPADGLNIGQAIDVMKKFDSFLAEEDEDEQQDNGAESEASK